MNSNSGRFRQFQQIFGSPQSSSSSVQKRNIVVSLGINSEPDAHVSRVPLFESRGTDLTPLPSILLKTINEAPNFHDIPESQVQGFDQTCLLKIKRPNLHNITAVIPETIPGVARSLANTSHIAAINPATIDTINAINWDRMSMNRSGTKNGAYKLEEIKTIAIVLGIPHAGDLPKKTLVRLIAQFVDNLGIRSVPSNLLA